MNQVIRCNDANEFNKLMEILQEKGYVWNNGKNPTSWSPYKCRYPITFDTECYVYINDCKIKYDYGEITPTYFISLDSFIIENGGRTEMEKFTKMNLQDGMIVRTREGRYYIYLRTFDRFIRDDGFNELNDYNDDLTNKNGINIFDIMAVYSTKTINGLDLREQVVGKNTSLIWIRQEPVIMTISEIEEKLGIKNLKVVAEK